MRILNHNLFVLIGFSALFVSALACFNGGYICTWDSEDGCDCDPCNAYHHYCDGHNRYPCPEGSDAHSNTASSCDPCDPGHFNPYPTHTCMPCPPGTYQPSYGQLDCISCQPGYYSTGGAASCTKSDTEWTTREKSAPQDMAAFNGRFQPEGNTDTGASMTAGYFGRFGFQMACHGNLYSTGGAPECDSCGVYMALDTHTGCNTTGLCDSGFFPALMEMINPDHYTDPWFTTPDVYTCVPCPPGAWCNGVGPPKYGHWYEPNATYTDSLIQHYSGGWRNSSPTSISTGGNAEGHFKQLVANDNIAGVDCSSGGYYLDLTSNQCHKCPPGYYCPANSNSAKHCDPSSGQYQPKSGQASCITEPMSVKWKFISTDATRIISCNAGQYPDMREMECKICPAGHKCTNGYTFPVLCNAYSEYQDEVGASTCKNCDLERYVSGDRTLCITCPTDSYYDFVQDRCTLCPAGHYCNGRYATRCTYGEWSEHGATTCSACEVEYTPNGGPTETVPGFIPPTRAKCVICQVGYYVDRDLATCRPCPKGHFCPDGVRKFSCRHGINDKGNLISISNLYQDELAQPECKDCELYVARNATICYTCPAGEFLDMDGYCRPCPAGFFCEDGQKQPCPMGTFSPGGGADRCQPCDYGITDDARTRCITCEDGRYSVLDGVDSFACILCESGYYCTGGYAVQCKPRFYAPEGSSRCLECYNGIVSQTQSSCTVCENGNFLNEDHTACSVCPAGSFCRNGDVFKCGPGTYSEGGAALCTTCDGFTDDDRTLCNSGVNGAMWAYQNEFQQNSFWAVSVPFGVLLLFVVFIDSKRNGCCFWPKDMVDPLKHKKDAEEEELRKKRGNERSAVKRVLKAGSLDSLAYKKAKKEKKVKDTERKLEKEACDAYARVLKADMLKNRGRPSISTRGSGPPSMRGGPPSMRGGPPSMRGPGTMRKPT